MNPRQAADRLLAYGYDGFDDHPLDYEDADQIARSVLIDGERWIVVLRRGSNEDPAAHDAFSAVE